MYPLKSVLVSFYWNGSASNTWNSSVFEQSFKTLWLVQNASQCCFSNCSHQSYKTCLGHVVVKHLNPLILPFLLSFSQKSWEILKTSLFYFDTCQVSPISRYVLLLLVKTSQHKFPRAESRWFHLNSYFGRGHGCGVGKCCRNDRAWKRGNRNERGLHSSANGGRGEILPKRGVLLVNGVFKIARIPSF